jgi:hypothetical protein
MSQAFPLNTTTLGPRQSLLQRSPAARAKRKALVGTSLLLSLAANCMSNDQKMSRISDLYAKVRGPWGSADEAELERLATEQRKSLLSLSEMTASTLEECQAKARVLRVYPETPSLLHSLLDDLEALS